MSATILQFKPRTPALSLEDGDWLVVQTHEKGREIRGRVIAQGSWVECIRRACEDGLLHHVAGRMLTVMSVREFRARGC